MKKLQFMIIAMAVCTTIHGQQINQSNNRYRSYDVLEKKQVSVKGFDMNGSENRPLTHPDSLLIRYSDWNRDPTHVSTCSNFEWMNGYEKEYLITSSCYIDSLKNLLANVQETENKYFPVTCKLYIFDSDTAKQIICMNDAYLKCKGKTYTNSEAIINYINHLMQMFTPYDSGRRFWPDIIGANYIGGKSALYQLLKKKIDEITHQVSCDNTIIMNIACRADKDGKTTDAEIKIVKPSQITEIERLIVKELKDYIINNIYWEEDLDREIYDVIYFTIRYSKTLLSTKNC